MAAEKALPFEPLVPNPKTLEAMKAARRGDGTGPARKRGYPLPEVSGNDWIFC